MEGVPRIQMLSFPMKRSGENPNFKGRLKSYILESFNEEPDSYSHEINELESLRAGAVHISRDYTGCSTLKKYLCQLNFLKSRFPLHEGSQIAISFSWFDVYSETAHGWSDIDFEMSCILYNIGALHSELGALDSRQTVDGMKNACTHFQCAAWAFQHLRYNYQKFFTPDISTDTLSIITNICLAQAQECVLEKSLVENRKSTITAKVSLQIVEYYQLALKTSDQLLKDASQYNDKLVKAVKKWRKLVELKVSYYGCLSYLYRGLQAEDDTKWGERVTFYKAAVEKLNESIKSSKSLEKTDTVHETLSFTMDVVAGKLSVSEKENEFVYHEKVPELDSIVSDIKGVSLVKGIPFKFDDPEIAGPDIFGRLVPMEAHEASSLYSEEKAKILRTYSKRIEEKNETLDKFLIALKLEQLDLHSEENRIPQELVDCCAALSVNQDAVKRLSEAMSKLSGMYHDTEANLQEILQYLQEQEAKEKEFQDIIGKRPPNNVITELSREVHKYQSAHTVASESNQTLHEAMSQHVANLGILMKPLDEVLKHIPSAALVEETDQEAIREMKRLTAKIDEMRKQREMLECQLRDSIHKDDITKQLVIKKDQDQDVLFQEELKKHDKITKILDQNLQAQENIIRAMTETNANYAATRKSMVNAMRKREEVINSLLSSYDAYDELLSKCNKGIEFYTKLDANVNKLLQRVKGVCKVQDEEREQAMQCVIKKSQASAAASLNSASANMMNYGTGIPPTSDPTSSHPKLKDYLNSMNASKNIVVPSGALDNSRTVQDTSYNVPTAGVPQMYNQQAAWGYGNYQNPSVSSFSPTPAKSTSPAATNPQPANYPVQNYQSTVTRNYPQGQPQQQYPAETVATNTVSGQSDAYNPATAIPKPTNYGQQTNWNYGNYQGQTSAPSVPQTQTVASNSAPIPASLQPQATNYSPNVQNYQIPSGTNYSQQPYTTQNQSPVPSALSGQNAGYNSSTSSQIPTGYNQQGSWNYSGYQYPGQVSTAAVPQTQTVTNSASPSVQSNQTGNYMQMYPNQAGNYSQQQGARPAGQNGITGNGYSYPQQQQQSYSNQTYPYNSNALSTTVTTASYTSPSPTQTQQGYTAPYSTVNKINQPSTGAYPYSYSYSQYPSQSQPQSSGPGSANYYYSGTSTQSPYGQQQNQQQYYNQGGNIQQQQMQSPQPPQSQAVYNPATPNTTSVVNNNLHSNNVQPTNRSSNFDLLSSIDFGAPNVEPLAPTPVSQTTNADK